jgi:acyl-CoA thioesterase FadM
VFIRTWVSRRGPLRFAFAYEVRREHDQAVTATAETVHICVDQESRPLRVPVWLDAVLELLAAQAEVDVPCTD